MAIEPYKLDRKENRTCHKIFILEIPISKPLSGCVRGSKSSSFRI